MLLFTWYFGGKFPTIFLNEPTSGLVTGDASIVMSDSLFIILTSTYLYITQSFINLIFLKFIISGKFEKNLILLVVLHIYVIVYIIYISWE